MITIYAIAYNEEKMIGFFIKWYRDRFPNCRIVIYDNQSIDKTVSIAEAHGCEVITYDTSGTLSDRAFLEIKNTCWKDAKTDWVFIGDIDELVDIKESQLAEEDRYGVTIIDGMGVQIINKSGHSVENIRHGVVHKKGITKRLIFNRRHIWEINYSIGAHYAVPFGRVQLSSYKYNFLHFKWLGYNYVKERYAIFASRLSKENIANGWSYHYKYSPLKIWLMWKYNCLIAKKVI